MSKMTPNSFSITTFISAVTLAQFAGALFEPKGCVLIDATRGSPSFCALLGALSLR